MVAAAGHVRGGSGFTGSTNTLRIVPGADHIGEVQAWTGYGARVWTTPSGSLIDPRWPPARARVQGGTHDRLSARSTRRAARVRSSPPTRASLFSPRRSSPTASNMSRAIWLGDRFPHDAVTPEPSIAGTFRRPGGASSGCLPSSSGGRWASSSLQCWRRQAFIADPNADDPNLSSWADRHSRPHPS